MRKVETAAEVQYGDTAGGIGEEDHLEVSQAESSLYSHESFHRSLSTILAAVRLCSSV